MSDEYPEVTTGSIAARQNREKMQRERQSSLAAMPGSARPSVNRISKYLRVVTEASLPGERGVISNDGKLIAILGYYKAWRQWVMYPQPNTVWSEDCLQAIREHLKQLGQVPNDQVLAQPGETSTTPKNDE